MNCKVIDVYYDEMQQMLQYVNNWKRYLQFTELRKNTYRDARNSYVVSVINITIVSTGTDVQAAAADALVEPLPGAEEGQGS